MPKIYKHILIPLDGSKLAEAALKGTPPLAKLAGAKVTLLQAVWPVIPVMETATMITQVEKIRKKEALSYLEKISKQSAWKGVKVNTVVKVGLAENIIINYARSKRVDLIVMSTHGRSGLKRWVFGSVADKVLRYADKPVLLVRAFSKEGK